MWQYKLQTTSFIQMNAEMSSYHHTSSARTSTPVVSEQILNGTSAQY